MIVGRPEASSTLAMVSRSTTGRSPPYRTPLINHASAHLVFRLPKGEDG
jgi:hypothetical protein